MSQFKAKQVARILSAPIKIVGVSVPNTSSSLNVTSALTSACTTAGEGGISIPLVASTTTAQNGVVVTTPINKCEIWDSSTKQKIVAAAAQNEIYGKITFASTVYTLSFYYLDNAGAEQTYAFTATTTIDFDFVYRYRFHEFPADGAIAAITKNVFQDPKGVGSVEFNEQLTVSSINTLTNMAAIPAYPTRTKLDVNGKIETPIGSSPAFTVVSNQIVWNATNAGYTLETTDVVFVTYYG